MTTLLQTLKKLLAEKQKITSIASTAAPTATTTFGLPVTKEVPPGTPPTTTFDLSAFLKQKLEEKQTAATPTATTTFGLPVTGAQPAPAQPPPVATPDVHVQVSPTPTIATTDLRPSPTELGFADLTLPLPPGQPIKEPGETFIHWAERWQEWQRTQPVEQVQPATRPPAFLEPVRQPGEGLEAWGKRWESWAKVEPKISSFRAEEYAEIERIAEEGQIWEGQFIPGRQQLAAELPEEPYLTPETYGIYQEKLKGIDQWILESKAAADTAATEYASELSGIDEYNLNIRLAQISLRQDTDRGLTNYSNALTTIDKAIVALEAIGQTPEIELYQLRDDLIYTTRDMSAWDIIWYGSKKARMVGDGDNPLLVAFDILHKTGETWGAILTGGGMETWQPTLTYGLMQIRTGNYDTLMEHYRQNAPGWQQEVFQWTNPLMLMPIPSLGLAATVARLPFISIKTAGLITRLGALPGGITTWVIKAPFKGVWWATKPLVKLAITKVAPDVARAIWEIPVKGFTANEAVLRGLLARSQQIVTEIAQIQQFAGIPEFGSAAMAQLRERLAPLLAEQDIIGIIKTSLTPAGIMEQVNTRIGKLTAESYLKKTGRAGLGMSEVEIQAQLKVYQGFLTDSRLAFSTVFGTPLDLAIDFAVPSNEWIKAVDMENTVIRRAVNSSVLRFAKPAFKTIKPIWYATGEVGMAQTVHLRCVLTGEYLKGTIRHQATHVERVLKMAEDGTVGIAWKENVLRARLGNERAAALLTLKPHIVDVMRYPEYFELTAAHLEAMAPLRKSIENLQTVLRFEGVSFNDVEENWFRKLVLGKETAEGKFIKFSGTVPGRVGAEAGFQKPAQIYLAAEQVAYRERVAGLTQAESRFIEEVYTTIGHKRVKDLLQHLGKTPKELLELTQPELIGRHDAFMRRYVHARSAFQWIKNIKYLKAEGLPGPTLESIRAWNPELAARIEALPGTLGSEQLERVIKEIPQDMWEALGVTPERFRRELARVRAGAPVTKVVPETPIPSKTGVLASLIPEGKDLITLRQAFRIAKDKGIIKTEAEFKELLQKEAETRLIEGGGGTSAKNFFNRRLGSSEHNITGYIKRPAFPKAAPGMPKVAPETFGVPLREEPLILNITKDNPVTRGQLTKAIMAIATDQKLATKMIRQFYLKELRSARIKRVELLNTIKARANADYEKALFDARKVNREYTNALTTMRLAKTVTLEDGSTVYLRPSFGHPAFQGRLFEDKVLKDIRQAFEFEGNKWLRGVSAAAGVMRTFTAVADFSAPFIQGLPLLGRHPDKWATATYNHFRMFKNPDFYQTYMARELDAPIKMFDGTILKTNFDVAVYIARHGTYFGGFEYFEYLPQLGKLFEKIPGKKVGQALGQTYGRFEGAWGFFGDGGRLEWAKVDLARITSKDELMRYSNFLNEATGVMSSYGLGVGVTQRQLESAFLFFAPRYTRAGFMFMRTLFRGGIAGGEARRALAGLLSTGMFVYIGTCAALGQTPQLNPFKGGFMTIRVGNERLGIGGIITAVFRLQANVLATLIGMDDKSPLDLVKLWERDNPFTSFLYARTSPITSTFVPLMMKAVGSREWGVTFMGEPFESPADYGRFLAERITPFALQEAIFRGTGSIQDRTIGFVFSELGLRVYPVSVFEHRNDSRELHAQEHHDKSWDGLALDEKAQLVRDHDDLRQLTDESLIRIAQFNEDTAEVYPEWVTEKVRIEDSWRNEATQIQTEYQSCILTKDQTGIRCGYNFRDRLRTANDHRTGALGSLTDNPRYDPIYDYFAGNQDTDSDLPFDVAYGEYIDILSGQDLEDEFGNFKYDLYNERIAKLKLKWGVEMFDRILQYRSDKRNVPALVLEYWRAREVLKPYFEINEEKYAGLYPKDEAEQTQMIVQKLQRENPEVYTIYRSNPEMTARFWSTTSGRAIQRYINSLRESLPTISSIVAAERKEWRAKHPEAEVYGAMFYDWQEMSAEEQTRLLTQAAQELAPYIPQTPT